MDDPQRTAAQRRTGIAAEHPPAGGTRPGRGFGVAATVPGATLRAVARAVEDAGFDAFWVNDGPDGEGLAALRVAADVTTRIPLAVGLIPLHRRSPAQIADRVAELALPVDRLVLGVGAGAGPGGLDRVRAGVAELRELTTAPVWVGALGPALRRLAAQIADGVLLDWPTPAHSRRCVEEIAQAAAAAGRPRPAVAGYVFTALGPAAGRRLAADAAHYGAVPAYAAHFDRMAATPLDAAAQGSTPQQVARRLAAWDSAWGQTVVRAVVAADTASAHLELVAATAPSVPAR